MTSRRKKIGRTIFITLVAVIIFFVIRWFIKHSDESYLTYTKPRIEVRYVKIKKRTGEFTNMDMFLTIDNALPVKMELNNLDYQIYIAGVEVMKTKYRHSINIKGNDTSIVAVPLIVKNDVLVDVLKRLEKTGTDSTEYQISGNGRLTFLAFKNKPFNFIYKKILPVIRMPDVKILEFKIKKLGLNKSTLLISLEIENKNLFSTAFKNFHYKFQVEKDYVASGKIEGLINIPAKSKKIVHLPLTFKTGETIETFFNGLFKAKSTDFLLLMDAKLVSDNNSLKDSQLIIELKGNLKDIKKLVLNK